MPTIESDSTLFRPLPLAGREILDRIFLNDTLDLTPVSDSINKAIDHIDELFVMLGNLRIHTNQLAAAEKIIARIKNLALRESLAAFLLIAPTQAGKTGTYLKLLERFMAWHRAEYPNFDVTRCAAVLVAKSDNSMLADLRAERRAAKMDMLYEVGHLTHSDIERISAQFRARWQRKQHSLLILDEGHLGLLKKSLIDRLLRTLGADLTRPRSEWENQYLEIVIVSATAFPFQSLRKVNATDFESNPLFDSVELEPGLGYYGLGDLLASGRVTNNLRYKKSCVTQFVHTEYLPAVRKYMSDRGLTIGHHILQVWDTTQARKMRTLLTTEMPGCRVVIAGDTSNGPDITPFLDVSYELRRAPSQQTFYILINTGGLGARICTRYLVGVLLRPTEIHSTLYQAIGRYLGYTEDFYPPESLTETQPHAKCDDTFPIFAPLARLDALHQYMTLPVTQRPAMKSTHNGTKIWRRLRVQLVGYDTLDALNAARNAMGWEPIRDKTKVWDLANQGILSDEPNRRAREQYDKMLAEEVTYMSSDDFAKRADGWKWVPGTSFYHDKISVSVRKDYKHRFAALRQAYPSAEYFMHIPLGPESEQVMTLNTGKKNVLLNL